ncbi:hypothetical protein PYW07_009447 [Mythimna separata]|uniref:protein-tyrosine-phosphatase n=1 Tax=Mythimna separata TaxID=271217 RepID=A0AAD7YBW6_MYTSE|nr:hypothetical protein PYW07_009447 [Mythimna separata]
MVHGQSYRPFQDATQGESAFTISLMDCLQAIKKARELGFFNFQDFNYEEYDRLDKIQGGDLNWIVPGKFLAFIGPVDYSVSLFHPPEMYITYFLDNDVKLVIRLNKRLYDGNVFNNVGIIHYDLFFPDGSCPPRHILFKFLQISEEANCAIAVHCKAGLGRTGSLIGCYLIKHYRMTSHEAIGWMRICRPGSVIGHQQGWLEQLEPWLIKQGNLYRKRTYQDTEKLPLHEFGVYSIAEKNMKQRPVVFHKSPSPPPPIQKQVRPTDAGTPLSQKSSKIKEALNKTTEKERDWGVKSYGLNNNSQKIMFKGEQRDSLSIESRRSSGAGDPRAGRPASRTSTGRAHSSKDNFKTGVMEQEPRNYHVYSPITTYRTSQAPVIKNVNDARNYLMRTSIYNSEREKHLNAAVKITPHQYRPRQQSPSGSPVSNRTFVTPMIERPLVTPKPLTMPPTRRRLGRSPSPPGRMCNEQSRATNTPSPTEKFLVKDASKTALKDVLSRLRLSMCRDGSLGAASLGATRDAPAPRRAPSVRSDERPLATQGDMLNSIKLQRRIRDTLTTEKSGAFHEKVGSAGKKSSNNNIKNEGSRNNNNFLTKPSNEHFGITKDNHPPIYRSFNTHPARPMSPKGRQNAQTNSFY